MTAESPLLAERKDGILTLTLNRPEARNALNQPLFIALEREIKAAGDDPDVRCVVLRASGRAFCAGGDLRNGGDPDPGDAVNMAQSREEGWPTKEMRIDRLNRYGMAFHRLHTMPKPTICAIQGTAAGAGVAIALACDFRIIARSAKLLPAFASVALAGDMGISYYLPLLAGHARAREILLLGDPLPAEVALQDHLVSRVVDDDDIDSQTRALALRLAQGPTTAYRYMKRNLAAAERMSFADLLEQETVNQRMASLTDDHNEARTAFAEKRKPVFKGI